MVHSLSDYLPMLVQVLQIAAYLSTIYRNLKAAQR